MAQKGFYIQSNTQNVINYVSMDGNLRGILRPKGEHGDTLFVPSAQTDDPTLVRLLARGTVVKCSDGDIRERDAAAVETRKRVEAEEEALSVIDDSQGDAIVERPCSAITAQGSKCKRKAYVTVRETEGDPRPFFCSSHEKQDPSDYVQDEEGEWVRKS